MDLVRKVAVRLEKSFNGSKYLMGLVVGVLVLVSGHVARGIDDVFPSRDTFSFTGLVKPLPVGSCVLASVCQTVNRSSRRWRFRHLKLTKDF